MGEKPAGVAVHIGARVMSQAGAGEVLVSQTVKDLVAGSGLSLRGARPARPEGRARRLGPLPRGGVLTWPRPRPAIP